MVMLHKFDYEIISKLKINTPERTVLISLACHIISNTEEKNISCKIILLIFFWFHDAILTMEKITSRVSVK